MTRPRRPRSPASWTALALALEQAGAYIDKQRLSFAEYLQRWEAKRPEVLRWHDLRLMQYPASVAVTWETTFAQLAEPERRLLEVLAWLAPEPIPLFLFDAEPLVGGHPRSPRGAGGSGGLLAGPVRRVGRRGPGPPAGAGDHPRPHSRGRPHQHAANRPGRRGCRRRGRSSRCPHLGVWTPLAAHAEAVSRHADAAGLAEPTARLMNQLGLYWKARGQFREPSR